jgi:hypothetical protein
MHESERLARRIFRLLSDGRFLEVPALVHPEAIIEPAARPGTSITGRESYVAYMQQRLSDSTVRDVKASSFHPVDERRIVVSGRLRWSNPGGGFRDSPVSWVLEFDEGLLKRSRHAPTLEEGLALLERDEPPA